MKTILIFKNQKCTLSFKLGNKGFSLLDNLGVGGGGSHYKISSWLGICNEHGFKNWIGLVKVGSFKN